MSEVKIRKLFKNGGSQAVRLPAEFQFEGDEVLISRDEKTGSVTLTALPKRATLWDFYDRAGYLEEDVEFMEERPLNVHINMRNVFADVEDIQPEFENRSRTDEAMPE